jgi:5-hydroxyisourate hydrolase-like protein (transthyretin family)
VNTGTADSNASFRQTLSLSITDVTRGRAAEGVLSTIERRVNGQWQTVAHSVSDSSGMISIDDVIPGSYRVELDAEPYFATAGVVALLPRVTITFRLLTASGHSLLQAYIAANSQFSVLVRSDSPAHNAANAHGNPLGRDSD